MFGRVLQYTSSLDRIMPSQKPYASLNIISELQKVTWPTRQETMKLTIVVVVGSLFVGLYIGGLDIIFAQMLRLITK